ncbi:polyprenyl synthetase family protein [Microbacterium hydrocarbonoxydans]|uniref:polyprenyl synthetase family protein n=1 Tax=Microbacterium hydrocarbonoxydans TaxID=273678 RepID=UPI0007BC6E47|nr:polyprenyl synthetase family protein [Microbacterium hydrocarbonoxydans]GAT73989.1 putative geranylgeranyl pyrophosphate synthase [Microbacterium sp. HM58-2]
MSAPVLDVTADVRARVSQTLRRQLAERTPSEHAYGPEFTRLWQLAAEHAAGGKLLRPLLLVETHAGLAQRGAEDAPDPGVLQVAALVEQLHFAFLLHDDVIDGDLRRRGTANLIGVLSGIGSAAAGHVDERGRELHWARSSALLMGDLLLSSALLGFARADLPAGARTRLLALVDHTVTETVAGEHGDVGLADGMIPPDLPAILATTARKTATYSFELPLRCAAILSGASKATETTLGAIGRRVGLAYQLQDDLLSAFGEHSEHGKDPFSDLREGKQTAIIAFARMTSAWPRIATRFGAPDLGPDEGGEMRELLRECGAERFVRRLVDEEFAAATAMATEAERSGRMPGAALDAVRTLLARLEGRRS